MTSNTNIPEKKNILLVESTQPRILQFIRGGSPIWATVYADMMTNLTLFFLMLFALNLFGEDVLKKAAESFRATIAGKVAPEIKIEKDKPKNAMEDIFKKLKQKEQIEDMNIDALGEGIRLRLPEPVLFDTGNADLKKGARPILNKLASIFKTTNNTIVIEGHTDNLPIIGGGFENNWELSMARAENVLKYFIYAEGISPNRLAIAGYGEYRPVAANNTPEGRSKNRRIELTVLYEEEKSR